MGVKLSNKIKATEQPARRRIIANIKGGIRYTYFANQIYTNQETPYGDRVGSLENRVIRKMIMNEELIVENTRIKIKTEDG